MPDMLELVEELCAFNSHTYNPAGVDRAGDIAERELAALGFTAERLPVPPGFEISRTGDRLERPLGRAVRALWNPTAPRRVLLCIHLDTVHLPDSPFATRREADRLIGPGVIDAKGGLAVLLEGARRFIATGETHLGLEVLLTPDEEVGSPSSIALLKDSASRCIAGLVYEPSFPDGAIVAGRKGSGTYTVIVRGRAAHAGRDFTAGRNAAVAAARAIAALDAINGSLPGVTVNVGVLEAGSASNVVPDAAVIRINVRVETPEVAAPLDAAIRSAAHTATTYRDGISVEVAGGLLSPPRPLDHRNQHLYDLAKTAAANLGIALTWRDSGGTCDGNKLASFGLPTIDSLGPVGGELHSTREYLLPATMPARAEITAQILLQLAAEK